MREHQHQADLQEDEHPWTRVTRLHQTVGQALQQSHTTTYLVHL